MKKRTAMLASFTLGTLLFAGTALADMTSKSGYEQLKDSLKLTAEKASDEFDSYTMDLTYVIKDNGQILQSENQVQKYDRKLNTTERNTTSEGINGSDSSYYYSDKQMDIRHGIEPDDKYYVIEHTEDWGSQQFSNPFEEDEAEDIERIVDAVVGSLKDHVIVKESADGNKELTGSLTEMQIPTIVNAVSSFQLKQVFNERPGMNNSQWPHLTQDIFVKEVTGSALISKDGVLENILGTATITGIDSQGQAHNLTIEVLGKLKDVNSTTVTKPDLTGKEVVKQQVDKWGPEMTNPQKFVGTFKNDILIEKEGKFAKAGERILEITQIDQNGFVGRYYEVIKPGFEDSMNTIGEFTFNGTFSKQGGHDGHFEISSDQGGTIEGNIYFEEFMGKISFQTNQLNKGVMMYDTMFSPVLE